MPAKNRFAEMHQEITAWRHHLHENPELMYEVHETAAFVVERLKEFGITDITTGVGQTGVVAVIEGKTNTSGRAIGLRADMDALPIPEASGVDYASRTPGVMHACGHDGHTSILLGAAKYLAETRNFDGKAVLIFQPAEEGGAGGKAMCDDGLMDRWGIQEVYGPAQYAGACRWVSSPYAPDALMASSDEFIHHRDRLRAAMQLHPHDAIDTTLVASQIVVSLHSIVSRNVDPVKRVVLTVGTFETDSTASNVIAHTAKPAGHRPHAGAGKPHPGRGLGAPGCGKHRSGLWRHGGGRMGAWLSRYNQ